MKTPSLILCAAAGLILFAAGCATTGGIPARVEEKSAVYATLQRWEKKYIDRGILAVGFTPDMVYMAVGHPTRVQANAGADSKGELWIYKRFFPTPDAHYTRFGDVAVEPTGQPATAVPVGKSPPMGQPNRGAGSAASNPNSAFSTGGPQGGSIEPSDMQSYTLYVLFEDGRVTKLGINPE